MKRTVLIISIFVLTILLLGCTESAELNNPYEGTCPKDKEEPCAGECGQFVDSNNDGYCDWGFI